MAKKPETDRVVARLTVFHPGAMTQDERVGVATWLQQYVVDFKRASGLTAEGDRYTDGRFTAKLYQTT